MPKKITIIILTIALVMFQNIYTSADDSNVPIIKTKVVTIPKIKPRHLKKKPKIIKKKPTKNKIVKVEIKKEEVTPKKVYVQKHNNVETINILISYYTSSVENCGNTQAIAASGKNLITASRGGSYKHYVAAPSNIPFGTRIEVQGVGTCQVEDRGGAIHYTYINGIRYMKLDVFVDGASQQELLNKGTLKTKGYIIRR